MKNALIFVGKHISTSFIVSAATTAGFVAGLALGEAIVDKFKTSEDSITI